MRRSKETEGELSASLLEEVESLRVVGDEDDFVVSLLSHVFKELVQYVELA